MVKGAQFSVSELASSSISAIGLGYTVTSNDVSAKQSFCVYASKITVYDVSPLCGESNSHVRSI